VTDPISERGSVSRRDIFRYGLGASALIALSPLVQTASGATTTARFGRTLPRSPRASTPTKGGTLKFARSVAPTTLDPANTIIAGDIYTLDKIFEPLYITSPAGQLTPWLATGYTSSADNKTLTFALRPSVKFSDGSPLTADDVVFSINRARTDAAGPLSFLDYAITKVEATGTSTVVIQLSAPWAPIISDISVFANSIIPANFGGKTAAEFFKAPIGTGPFTLSSFTPDATSLTLKANPHYWQPGKPYLDSVEFLYVDNDNQRILQIEGGQVNIIDTVPPSNVAQLKSNSSVVLDEFPAWEVDLLVMNEKLPQFADVHVRRAITYAIDRPAIVHAANFGTGLPAGSFFPPSLEYYSAATPVLEFSVAKAKAELAQSKYPKGFATKILVDSGNEKFVTYATIIKSQLQAIDIDVTITGLDHSAFESTFQKYDYEMFIDYAINDISDPDEMASFELNYKDGGSESYWSSFNDPAITALVNEAEGEFNTTKRAALYAQIQSLVAEAAPFVPIDYPPYIYAKSKSVQGFNVNPGGAYRLENVWLT
jgi:peptide/nickel transport system substrate-binding protein